MSVFLCLYTAFQGLEERRVVLPHLCDEQSLGVEIGYKILWRE